MCDKCLHVICFGPEAQCLNTPTAFSDNAIYERRDVWFICPLCHQDGDHKAKKPSPYYVCSTLQSKVTTVGLTAILRASIFQAMVALQIRPRLGHPGNLSLDLQLKFMAAHSSFHDRNS